MSTPPFETPDARAAAATAFVNETVTELEPLQRALNEAQWRASITGSAEDAAERARLDARLRVACADPERLRFLDALLAAGGVADPVRGRELVVLHHLFRAHQMPQAVIERMVQLENGLDQTFNNHRAELDGERLTDNQLREILQRSEDVPRRKRAWEAFKQIGAQVVAPLLQLVRIRNQAARDLGFRNYYAMMLELDELDERELFALLDDVERGTLPVFQAYRRDLDRRLERRFRIAAGDVRPWHFGDPFFQEAPPADLDDLDRHFRSRDLVRMADGFFSAVGLPLDGLLERADLYEKPGKSQHAFCLSVDRGRDVRVLCNIQPNEFWMSVTLHEFGHAVYDVGVDARLPWLLRTPAHTLTTEASAMLFGRLSKNAAWLERWAEMPADEAARIGARARQAVRDQLLVQTRWNLVMCHMERALYDDPEQDLDTRWWDLVERFQLVRRPEGRRAPDWASKIHFSAAPVYYHNYLLGEIMASQLQAAAVDGVLGGGAGARKRLVTAPELGRFLTERLYALGKTVDWRGAIHSATGSTLRPDAYVADLAARD